MTVFRSISFCNLFHLLSVSVLFPPDLSSWCKAKPFLGHNIWASCTTSPALLLPLWSYPCLSLSLSVSCLLLYLTKCVPAVGPLHVEPSWPGRLFLQWLHDLFPHSQVSSGITKHRFPQLLSSNIKAFCPSSPATAIYLVPLLHLHSEHFYLWGISLSLPLRWWRAAGEQKLCWVLLHPRTKRGSSIW